MARLRTVLHQAWLSTTDDISEASIAQVAPEALFKLGVVAGLQLVGQHQRRGSKALDRAIAEALEMIDQDPS